MIRRFTLSRSALLIHLILSFAIPTFAQTKIALVLDKGGKDDKSFNSAAFAGATQAQKELGIEFKYVEASDLNALENFHRSFAKKGYDLIIGVGFAQTDAVKKVAGQFPQQKFAIVDGKVDAPNVKALLFEEQEGSFLVGAIAALKAKSKTFGFIGGMDIPLIRRFEMGYVAGIKHIEPNAKITSQYVGVTNEAWNNPTKARELALSQYGAGAEVIFAAAGASGAGVFDAAESKKAFVIGVDSNQNALKPGRVLTSMLKRVDVAVFETIKDVKDGKFKPGIAQFGLKNQGVDYALDTHNAALITPEIKSKVDKLKGEIIAGKIKVPDYYQSKKM